LALSEQPATTNKATATKVGLNNFIYFSINTSQLESSPIHLSFKLN
jgi:hypothetical protein